MSSVIDSLQPSTLLVTEAPHNAPLERHSGRTQHQSQSLCGHAEQTEFKQRGKAGIVNPNHHLDAGLRKQVCAGPIPIANQSQILKNLFKQKVLQVGFPIAHVWVAIFYLLGKRRHDRFNPRGFFGIREWQQPDRQTGFFL